MAGVSEKKAKAAERKGRAYARHLGVKPNSARHDRIVYGTKRKAGWKPAREVHGRSRGARYLMRKNRGY